MIAPRSCEIDSYYFLHLLPSHFASIDASPNPSTVANLLHDELVRLERSWRGLEVYLVELCEELLTLGLNGKHDRSHE